MRNTPISCLPREGDGLARRAMTVRGSFLDVLLSRKVADPGPPLSLAPLDSSPIREAEGRLARRFFESPTRTRRAANGGVTDGKGGAKGETLRLN